MSDEEYYEEEEEVEEEEEEARAELQSKIKQEISSTLFF